MADHLLPPSATELLRQLSLAAERATSLPVEIRDEWSPQRCASHMLPWLAWAFGVEEWDVTWTDAQKRAAITSALAIKRTKGTIGAVVSTVEDMGLGAQVVEWFNQEPAGAPYTYDLIITAEEAGFTQQQLDLLLALIERTKNVRSHLDELLLQVQSRATLYTAGAPLLGLDITLAYEGDVVPTEPAEPTDPILLMHFDVEGPGGGPIDSSANGYGAAFFGNAGIDSYQSRWGVMLNLGGAGGAVAYAGGAVNAPPPIGTGPFTVEFWVLPVSTSQPYVAYFMSGGKQLPGSLWIANDQEVDENRLEVRCFDGDAELVVIPSSAATVIDYGPTSNWTHVALVRNGDQFALYLNGQQVAANNHPALYLETYDVLIGVDGTSEFSVSGYIDELRFSRSAVYTADFTTQESPFT